MNRSTLLTLLFLMIANAGICMESGIRVGCSKAFHLWYSPLATCAQFAEWQLERAAANQPLLNYRIALCKRLLKRDNKDVLSAAAVAANNDMTGLAQFFYASLLKENHDDNANEWFDRAAKNGIGWEEFIRDEQMQLHGN